MKTPGWQQTPFWCSLGTKLIPFKRTSVVFLNYLFVNFKNIKDDKLQFKLMFVWKYLPVNFCIKETTVNLFPM